MRKKEETISNMLLNHVNFCLFIYIIILKADGHQVQLYMHVKTLIFRVDCKYQESQISVREDMQLEGTGENKFWHFPDTLCVLPVLCMCLYFTCFLLSCME